MTTFSAIVDSIVQDSRRPDQLSSIVTGVNQAIRIVHTPPNRGAFTLFDANRVEDELTATASPTYLWPLPSVPRFQRLEAAWHVRLGRYFDNKKPSIAKRHSDAPYSDLLWYMTGPAIAFGGVQTNEKIHVSYFMYPPQLKYLTEANRLIDPDTYLYLDPGAPGVPTQEEMDAETNWILQRWPTVIRQGALSHFYRAVGDTDRGRLAYSSFESQRLSMWQLEPTTVLST